MVKTTPAEVSLIAERVRAMPKKQRRRIESRLKQNSRVILAARLGELDIGTALATHYGLRLTCLSSYCGLARSSPAFSTTIAAAAAVVQRCLWLVPPPAV